MRIQLKHDSWIPVSQLCADGGDARASVDQTRRAHHVEFVASSRCRIHRTDGAPGRIKVVGRPTVVNEIELDGYRAIAVKADGRWGDGFTAEDMVWRCGLVSDFHKIELPLDRSQIFRMPTPIFFAANSQPDRTQSP